MKKILWKTTDLEVTPVVFGTGNFKEKIDKDTAFRLLDHYVDKGGNFLDTANVYCRWLPDTTNSSEQYLGEWLGSRKNRDKLVIATKGGHPNLATGENTVNKENLTRELDESLMTLGVDYVDFYWLHRDNENMSMEEVIELGENFVKAGKIRYFGASNYKLHRMKEAMEIRNKTGKGFSALSNQWSLAYPNPGYKLVGDNTLEGIDHSFYEWLKESGLTLVPYSATAIGYFGKYQQGKLTEHIQSAYGNARNEEIAELLIGMAEKYNTNPFALSVAILMAQDFQVFPVASFSNEKQLDEFLESADIELDSQDIELLNKYL